MEKYNIGALGLVIEIITLAIGGTIYMNGLGVGAQGIVPMLTSVAIAGVGLFSGGIMGAVSLMRNGGKSIVSVVAIFLPLTILTVLVFRRIWPL